MRFFRLGGGVCSGAFIFWLLVCLSEDESVENFLLGDCRVSSTGLIVIGSPNAPASVHTLVLFDLRLGFLDWCCLASGVLFWLTLLGDGARFSDVEDPESVVEPDVAALSDSLPRCFPFGCAALLLFSCQLHGQSWGVFFKHEVSWSVRVLDI